MKIADIAREYRLAHKMSLRQFAESCGCSFQYLSKLEKGVISHPSLDMVMKLSNGMGIPVSHLLLIAEDGNDVIEGKHPERMSEEYIKARDALYSAYSESAEKIQKSVCTLLDLDYIPPYKNRS